ncbi:TetR/AcrR family transcriptional regulator [Vibrio bivalvicida]|uniref:TetR/AcrR family transcriptional regulator n=1 Tax=Vibrio bivalvicida TaxID=1276888 RepID=A0ABV4MI52_9VIBR
MSDLRTKLLDVGFELANEQGFAGLGLSKIINAANATKGSFYHHFSSKEDFGSVLLSTYFDDYLAQLDQFLEDETLSAQDRIRAYFENWATEKITSDYQIKCLIVKLSGEISGTSSQMSQTLAEGADKVICHLGDYINRHIESGEFKLEDGYQTARLIYGMWIGTTLMLAILQDRTLLDNLLKETMQLFDSGRLL